MCLVFDTITAWRWFSPERYARDAPETPAEEMLTADEPAVIGDVTEACGCGHRSSGGQSVGPGIRSWSCYWRGCGAGVRSSTGNCWGTRCCGRHTANRKRWCVLYPGLVRQENPGCTAKTYGFRITPQVFDSLLEALLPLSLFDVSISPCLFLRRLCLGHGSLLRRLCAPTGDQRLQHQDDTTSVLPSQARLRIERLHLKVNLGVSPE